MTPQQRQQEQGVLAVVVVVEKAKIVVQEVVQEVVQGVTNVEVVEGYLLEYCHQGLDTHRSWIQRVNGVLSRSRGSFGVRLGGG